MNSEKTRVLILAPGAIHSTYDVYKYYADAFRERDDIFDIEVFSYHNLAIVHKDVVDNLKPNLSQNEKLSISLARAARECIVEIGMFQPDFVFSISGLAVPISVWQNLLDFRQALKKPFGMINYFTECPYMDDMQSGYKNIFDIIYLNDKYSLPKYDPDNSHYVTYLPHSYNPKVHFAGEVDEEYKSDLLFCGTAFYERVSLLSKINFDNINFKLFGFSEKNLEPEHYEDLKEHINNAYLLSNDELAEYYRGAKVSLNIHRTSGDIDEDGTRFNNYTDAYSMGPRLYEIAACGSLIITDYRKEVEDVFGDSVVYFEGRDQLQEKINYWTDDVNADKRLNMVKSAKEKVSKYTFLNRLNEIIIPDILSVQEMINREIENG